MEVDMNVSRIRILVVDDHRLMLEGVVRILRTQSDLEVVGVAASAEEALEQYRLHQPDITLMDLELRGSHGVQAIRAIRAIHAAARIIVLTMYSGEEDVFGAVDAGASAYVLKDAIPEDLIGTIRAVYGGETVLAPQIEALVQARRDQPSLTRREVQVLRLLIDGKRDKEIAADLRISHRTAEVHIRSIFDKLNVHDRTAALATAIRRGIIHLP
jgi:two-component system NarL family response regulator